VTLASMGKAGRNRRARTKATLAQRGAGDPVANGRHQRQPEEEQAAQEETSKVAIIDKIKEQLVEGKIRSSKTGSHASCPSYSFCGDARMRPAKLGDAG